MTGRKLAATLILPNDSKLGRAIFGEVPRAKTLYSLAILIYEK